MRGFWVGLAGAGQQAHWPSQGLLFAIGRSLAVPSRQKTCSNLANGHCDNLCGASCVSLGGGKGWMGKLGQMDRSCKPQLGATGKWMKAFFRH